MSLAIAAANAYLDRIYATAPGTTVEWGLLDGDPDAPTELDSTDCPGYARYTISSWATFWPTAATGGVKTSAAFSFPDATDAWDRAGEFEGLFVDGVLWDWQPLAEAVAPSGAGPFSPVQVSRRAA